MMDENYRQQQLHLDEVGIPLVVQSKVMASTVAHAFHYLVNR
jgi:hypothetical protein